MTYWQFHVVFTLPMIGLFWWLNRHRSNDDRSEMRLGLLFLCALSLTYTTPWDNVLVKNSVWGYPEDRVLFTIGHVPIEEYAFFLLQTIMSGLWLFWFLHRFSWKMPEINHAPVRWMGCLFYLAVALMGWWWFRFESTYYLGLITLWAAPVGMLQWAFGGDVLWASRRVFFTAILVPTVYLCLADRIAIALNIWFISERFTTGLHILGLPLEEALFFLVTNVMVVQGLMLFWCRQLLLKQGSAAKVAF